LLDTVRTNKSIENYYKKYEDEEGDIPEVTTQFDKIMSFLGAIYPAQELANTNWRRPQLFYTFFTSIGHCLFGLDGLDRNLKTKITEKNVGKLRVIFDEISLKYDEYTEDKEAEIPSDYKDFINYSRRGTTDSIARITRSNFVCQIIKTSFAS
jgi:hypothetical protein